MADESAQLELISAYRWIWDPRIARFHLYVDGKKVGSAPPQGGSCRTKVAAGSHTARTRLWWYLSPSVSFDVASGQCLRMEGDIPRQLSVPKRMLRMLIHPFNSLTLSTENV